MKQNEDAELIKLYEGNGLFAKIIDTPAEEAFRCGFRIKGDAPEDVKENAMDILDWIHWEEKATEAVKLSRLYGGSLIVMLINDGCGLEKPLKLEKIQSVDGLMVYDRSAVQPSRDEVDGDSCPTPEYYKVFSRYGTFTVHESRCMVFRNGELTERSLNSNLWPWGIPEAYRFYGALAEAEVSHGAVLRLLDKSANLVLRIHELSKMSEAQVLRRLDVMDISRGLCNTTVLDMEDDFSFLGEIPEGIMETIDVSDRALSAATGIPETILWGKPIDYEHPGQLWRKHDGTSWVWHNYVEGIQNGMVKANLWRLLSIIFRSYVNIGLLPKLPKFDVEFEPLWHTSPMDQANIDRAKADKQLSEAQTAAMYVEMGSITPKEVRRGLQNKKKL